MPLPPPNYPSSQWDGNEQDTTNDPGAEDPTLAEARDYNEMSSELVAVIADILAALDDESKASLAAVISGFRSEIDSFAVHADQHKHGGADEVATSAPTPNAIPKAGGTGSLSTGWIQQATENARGALELATQAETNAEVDDTRAITPLKLGAWHDANHPGGEDYQSAVSAARSTTTSTTFQVKATLTTPALTGTYRVAWSAIVDQAATNQYVESRLYNATDAAVVFGPDIFQPNNLTERKSVGGVAEVVFAGAAKTLEIQYRASGSTAGIQQARLELWRIA